MPGTTARASPTPRHGGWWLPMGAASHRPHARSLRPNATKATGPNPVPTHSSMENSSETCTCQHIKSREPQLVFILTLSIDLWLYHRMPSSGQHTKTGKQWNRQGDEEQDPQGNGQVGAFRVDVGIISPMSSRYG